MRKSRPRSIRPEARKIICTRCQEERYHEAKEMCSSCLRRTKRETKPEFYLGTVYSTMKARTKGYGHTQYKDRLICTREEFKEKFIKDKTFLNQYKIWQDNNFQRKFAPSIDRIDNEKDYTLDNIEFIPLSWNSWKDKGVQCFVKNLRTNEIKEYKYLKNLAKYIGYHPATVSRKLCQSNSFITQDKRFEVWK